MNKVSVGAGLLAKAAYQTPMLSTDTPPSRASPLPQVFSDWIYARWAQASMAGKSMSVSTALFR
ncbi:hypothetical protein C1X61_26830 [Pseudomonas sp. FW215-T2]|nr:hypothetical protein C1X61_26830 [Pseudomonas sp. FW215-T2]PNA08133.1 hypothetical protein C1X62_26480 [Pseudomonas sp. FW215-R3]PNB34316.1 hypothetical protein C1X63_27880 [Pseudomonas sp. FW305-131]